MNLLSHIKGVGFLPGMLIMAMTVGLRLSGSLQFQEWWALDYFLRSRPSESSEQRITIIGLNEADIDQEGYPIPDREIARLLETLQTYQPRVVGLDIAKNLATSELITTLQKYPHQLAIAKILPEAIAPPPGLSSQQVGFVDVINDRDSHLRRVILGMPCPDGPEYQFSLIIRLTEIYLAVEGITLATGKRDRQAMRFGSVEIPRFRSNSGAYLREDEGGVQMLLNFRQGKPYGRMLSLQDIKTGNFNPSDISDRIVIIGMTAVSVGDVKNTAATPSHSLPRGKVYGVEIIAHGVSQIINTVLDDRPMLYSWSEMGEYAWIVAWSMVGITLAGIPRSPWQNFLAVILAIIGVILLSYLVLLWWGLWLPVVPATMALGLNGVVLTSFYYQDRALRSLILERQKTIDRTYDSIHNGPLQTLKLLIRHTRDGAITLEDSLTALENLDREMRSVYDALSRQTKSLESTHLTINGQELDLRSPLPELLYQVYIYTLERDFPYFATIKVKVPIFDSFEEQNLTLEQKRSLCQFLEEALCNVGKYAEGVTRLEITCTQQQQGYLLRIVDNGKGIDSNHEGRGTKQAHKLARQLKGQFSRQARSPKGTICQLIW